MVLLGQVACRRVSTYAIVAVFSMRRSSKACPYKGNWSYSGSEICMLLNKHIVVGVCGGIASYKAVDLVSKLQQAGALVDVIMTEHAEDFVRPLTFATMSHRSV